MSHGLRFDLRYLALRQHQGSSYNKPITEPRRPAGQSTGHRQHQGRSRRDRNSRVQQGQGCSDEVHCRRIRFTKPASVLGVPKDGGDSGSIGFSYLASCLVRECPDESALLHTGEDTFASLLIMRGVLFPVLTCRRLLWPGPGILAENNT